MAKIYLFSVFCLFSYMAEAQFEDDFSDGDFTQNPLWIGNDDLFLVIDEQLRSNSPEESLYYLSTESQTATNAQWEFFINLGFATSGVNFADVYVISDNSDLGEVQNGYFLRFGGTTDEISLYKIVDDIESVIIDGEDGVIGSSSNNPYQIRLSRNEDNLWLLEYDEGVSGIYTAGGTVTDSEITSSEFFGIKITQSSAASPVNNHFFDDFVVGPIPVDETAPEIISGQVLSSNQVKLIFSEILDQSSAEDAGNYIITPFGLNPISAVLENPTEVTLSFADDFISGNSYTIVVVDVEDLSGNTIDNANIQFLYVEAGTANYKQVVFNEIMADPDPQVGLPNAEYFELFNASDEYFNLQDWSFVNTSTVKALPDYLLEPGAYLILCDENDADLFSLFGDVLPIPSFTALSNSGDSLSLLNSAGEIIDIVVYSSNWYQDPDKDDGGYSLELINPYTECSGANNWHASDDESGGTPGEQNAVFNDAPDTEAPQLVNSTVLDLNNLQLNFSEVMDENSLLNGEYSIDNGINAVVSGIDPSNESIVLSLDPALEIGVVYTITVQNVTDCEGNTIGDQNSETFVLGIAPEAQDVIITEIMADPGPSVGLPEAEYLEIYNGSESVIDLTGASISGAFFPEASIIFPGEYKLLVGETQVDQFYLFYPELIAMESMSSTFLTNGGKELLFISAEGELIDRVNYNESWYQNSEKEDGGWSLEIKNLNEPCRGKDNWAASVNSSGGTPESQNSLFSNESDSEAPVLLSILVYSSTELILNFNEALDSISVFMAAYQIDPAIEIDFIENVFPAYESVRIQLAGELQENTQYQIMVEQIADCSGNIRETTQSITFGLPEPALPGDIIINEVLFNPNTGGSDFVELYNNSSKIISLQNWKLENNSASISSITEEPILILPGDFIVLTPDPENIIQEYPQGRIEKFYEVNSLPTFANAEGSVILLNDSLQTMDRLDYYEEMHFELLNDFKGVSLERIDYNQPTNDPSNWASAAETIGFATPGYQNSQYMNINFPDTDFKVDPEAFSPDSDGFQDVMILTYRMGETGYVANIGIYDREGLLRKTLARNSLLASEGFFTWDGYTDDQQKARIGVYLISIEIFDLSGNVKMYKESCVVAGRISN